MKAALFREGEPLEDAFWKAIINLKYKITVARRME